MANVKSAIKRIGVNEKKRTANTAQKSALRSEIKRVEGLVEANDAENAKVAMQTTTKHIDKAVQKGLIHKNAGDRQKSRLTKKVNAL
ncbi:30S ribosomal protein S20 [Oceanobacillus damuensis]|uniref:30S ribosomal protein S20 n=1 Tax=Oceanobacillus damuensis TaxID=937928 RepID=UPI00082AE1BB|nr:30S ribosomal protein S20 [Oceanobacillus damuensis]